MHFLLFGRPIINLNFDQKRSKSVLPTTIHELAHADAALRIPAIYGNSQELFDNALVGEFVAGHMSALYGMALYRSGVPDYNENPELTYGLEQDLMRMQLASPGAPFTPNEALRKAFADTVEHPLG